MMLVSEAKSSNQFNDSLDLTCQNVLESSGVLQLFYAWLIITTNFTVDSDHL